MSSLFLFFLNKIKIFYRVLCELAKKLTIKQRRVVDDDENNTIINVIKYLHNEKIYDKIKSRICRLLRGINMLEIKSEKFYMVLKTLEKGSEGVKEDKTVCISEDEFAKKKATLFKNVAYEAVAVNKTNEMLEFKVGGKPDIICRIADENVFSGVLLFESMGLVQLDVAFGGEVYACINLEICPKNEDFKQDFETLMKSTNNIIYSELARINVSYSCFEKYFNYAKRSIETLRRKSILKKIRSERNEADENRALKIKEEYENAKQALSDAEEYFYSLIWEKRGLLYGLETSFYDNCKEKESLKQIKNIPKEILKFEKMICSIGGDYERYTYFDIENLYSYWCFLQADKLIAESYTALAQDKIVYDGKKIIIDPLANAETRYIDIERDCEVVLKYAVEEIPIISLTLKKRSSKFVLSKECVLIPLYCKCISDSDKERLRCFKAKMLSGQEEAFSIKKAIILYCGENKVEDDEFELVPFMPDEFYGLNDLVEKCFKEILSGEGIGDVKEIDFSDIIALPKRIDISKRNVLVAVVKTPGQFYLNMDGNFYYIPEQYIENGEDIEYVAIYQSKHLFGEDYGIKHFGKVIKAEKKARYDISEIPKNSDETYYRFTLDGWLALENKIKPKNFPKVSMYTNMFLLKNAEEYFELLFENNEEYELYRKFREISANDLNGFFRVKRGIINISGNKISAYKISGEKLVLKRDGFNENPLMFSKNIAAFFLRDISRK